LDTSIDVINTHSPLVKLPRRKTKLASKPWITKGILKSIKAQKRLFRRKIKHHKNVEYLQTYKKYNNIKEKSCTISKISQKVKGIFRKRGKLLMVKTNIPPLATSTNASNPLDTVNMSNILNVCFVEIGPTLASSIPPTALVPHTSGASVMHSFFLSPVLPEDVVLQINLLNPSKSSDTYDFPVSSLKISRNVIAPYLANLYNLCITDSVFPTRLKLAKVIPVYKSGDKTQPSKYRPMSLLSHFSKIFEKLVSTNLLSFLAQNSILCPQQFGFRQGLSTSLALLKLQVHILEQILKNYLHVLYSGP